MCFSSKKKSRKNIISECQKQRNCWWKTSRIKTNGTRTLARSLHDRKFQRRVSERDAEKKIQITVNSFSVWLSREFRHEFTQLRGKSRTPCGTFCDKFLAQPSMAILLATGGHVNSHPFLFHNFYCSNMNFKFVCADAKWVGRSTMLFLDVRSRVGFANSFAFVFLLRVSLGVRISLRRQFHRKPSVEPGRGPKISPQ